MGSPGFFILISLPHKSFRPTGLIILFAWYQLSSKIFLKNYYNRFKKNDLPSWFTPNPIHIRILRFKIRTLSFMLLLLDHIFLYKNKNWPKRLILVHIASLRTFSLLYCQTKTAKLSFQMLFFHSPSCPSFLPLTLRPAELQTCFRKRAQSTSVLFLVRHSSQCLTRKCASSCYTEIDYEFGNKWILGVKTWRLFADSEKSNCLSCMV